MNEQDEIETSLAYTPKEEQQKDKWIFSDSEDIPEELTFNCEAQKRSSNGILIPCLKFTAKQGQHWYLSLWSKPNVPMKIVSGDVCKVYKNKDKKIEVLKLS